MKIILCSSSPRRKEILSRIIDDFDIHFPKVDEGIIEGESPLEYANRISKKKTEYLTSNVLPYKNTILIIGCDTIVTIDNMIIGKPKDHADAMRKIKLLNGKTHKVISSITLSLVGGKDKTVTNSEITDVTFKNLNEKDIIKYLDIINYRDKAGAYALQENGKLIIKEIRGSTTNVIGFPLRLFFKLLSELNILESALSS